MNCVLESLTSGPTFYIWKDRMEFGRDPRCDISIRDITLSRKTFTIVKEHGQCVLVSESKLPVYVNGRVVADQYVLQEGDEIRVADFHYRVHYYDIETVRIICPQCRVKLDVKNKLNVEEKVIKCPCCGSQLKVRFHKDSNSTNIEDAQEETCPLQQQYQQSDDDPCQASLQFGSEPSRQQTKENELLYVPQKTLTSRIGSLFRRSDQVNSAVFAPSTVARGDDMMVQVYVYKDEETDQIVVDAKCADKKAEQRSYVPLNFKLRKGDKVSVSLCIKSIKTEDQVRDFVWQGRFTKCAFFVSIPSDYSRNQVMGEVVLSVNGLQLGQLLFLTEIGQQVSSEGSAEVKPKPYKKVFISYSHKDEKTVKAIADAYRALGVVDYFYDRHTLSPGEIYERKIFDYIDSCDLFILCWSKNAEDSEWVRKERVRAFYAALDVPPRLRLYPINISPFAPPPADMVSSFHFEDYDKLQ